MARLLQAWYTVVLYWFSSVCLFGLICHGEWQIDVFYFSLECFVRANILSLDFLRYLYTLVDPTLPYLPSFVRVELLHVCWYVLMYSFVNATRSGGHVRWWKSCVCHTCSRNSPRAKTLITASISELTIAKCENCRYFQLDPSRLLHLFSRGC